MRGIPEHLPEAEWRERVARRGIPACSGPSCAKGFLDELVPLGGRGAHVSALAVAIEQRREDVPPPSSLIA